MVVAPARHIVVVVSNSDSNFVVQMDVTSIVHSIVAMLHCVAIVVVAFVLRRRQSMILHSPDDVVLLRHSAT